MRLVSIRWALAFAVMIWAITGSAAGYDPLAVAREFKPKEVDPALKAAKRDRTLPISVYLPESEAPAPVILFSHGLGGTRNGSRFLGNHWAKRGYVVIYLQHPGSDDSVWRNAPKGERLTAMNQAASLENLILRVQDVPVVLDQIESWNTTQGHVLFGRLDLKSIGMSGHSFGAITTQMVSGQKVRGAGQKFTDKRIKAAIAFSPTTPQFGNPSNAFGEVRIPWMLMTGTKDLSPIGHADLDSRLGVYPALSGSPKYELVLHNARHSVFTDHPLPSDPGSQNANHHRVILALSTAFWDAYLKNDAEALSWLAGDAPRSVMETPDRWRHKP